MKNTIRISVGIAALISAAALANAQAEIASPQGDANYEAQALEQARATETQPPQQGAEEQGAAAGERGGQALEEQAERNAAAARQRAEEQGAARPGANQGAEQKGITGEHSTTQGQTLEENREHAGQTGLGTEEGQGANPQGKAAEQRLEQSQQPYAQGQRPYAQHRGAQPGAQQRGTMRQGQTAPAQPGGSAARQQWTQGQARAQGSISPDQQARIRDRVRNEHSARAGHADFGLNVGAVVPRSERLAVLPEDVVTIAPRFRGYKFVIVEDEIVIVDPRTYRVAAIIPEAGGPGVEPSGPAPLLGGPGVRGCVRC
jgi:hypothetical protein